MTEKEFKDKLLKQLAGQKTTGEIREIIKKASETLDESKFSKDQQRDFFGDLLSEAQDNSATMANAGAAQQIVNQVLGG